MRNIIITAIAASGLIGTAALAQSAGNMGSTNSNASNTGASSHQNNSTLGGISLNPSFSSTSTTSSNKGSSGGDTGSTSSDSKTTSRSASLPLAFDGATLGGNSHNFNRGTNNSNGRTSSSSNTGR